MKEDNVTVFFKVIAIVLCVAIIIVGGLYIGWLYLTGGMTGEVYNPNVSININDGVIREISLGTLEDKIISWHNNGQPARDDGVTNILLIGIDVDSADMNLNSRADAMVILSINHNTKRITLASILRDQYCYMEYGDKKNFEKLHHANNYGGPAFQISLIERYYKISIDSYALVNFYSLPKIIDKMDGVTVNITKNEADYMNTYWGTKVKTGENRIDGATALIYMRIRHKTGGDAARVGRQQQVIKSILNEIKSQSKTELLSLVTEITQYIRTGYSSEQLLSLAADVLVNGWLEYDMVQYRFPDDESAVGTTIDGIWYWKVDYPVCAQKMQWALFNKTNIELFEDRASWIK